MNSALFLVAFLIPSLLLAYPTDLTRPTPSCLVTKSLSSKGKKLLHTIWSLAKQHRWHTLKHKMSSHFSVIGVPGEVATREEELAYLQGLEISNVEFQVLKVVSVSDKVLAIQYSLSLTSQSTTPEITLPSFRMSLFTKEHGEWLWKADADMNTFIVDL